MEDEAKNGLPKLTLYWNAELQSVALDFDNKQLKTWEFVVGLLQMGLAHAQEVQRVTKMQQLANQAMQNQALQAMRGKLIRAHD